MNKKALIFLFLAIVSFFISLFFNFEKINIPYYGSVYKEIQADIIFKKEPPNVFYDNKEIKTFIKIDKNHYLFKSNDINLVKKVKFKNHKNIEKLIIYNGNKATFYNDNVEEININNNKCIFNKISLSILSFFVQPKFYTISYIFLFFFLYNFQFKCKKTKNIILTLLILSLILRLTQLNNVPFWDDEIYILTHTNKWIETLQDPGNPPLYFILFKLYKTIIQNPDLYRLSSVLLGVLFNFCFYIYIKHFLGKKTGLIALFLASINIALIYFSQEIRCYMLLMLLAIINSYFLFKFNNKTKFNYLISVIALLNTHFYGAFYVFYNFIFGLSIFKNKTKIKNFILINLVAFLSFLPILIYKKTSISSNFNSWIPLPIKESYLSTLNLLFGNIFVLIIILLIILIIYFKTTSKNRLFIKYNCFAILFTMFFAIIFSYLIKPIYNFKYFYIVFPNALAIVSFVYGYLLKKRFGLILIFFLFFTLNYRFSTQNLYCNHNLFFDFIRSDINKTKANYIFATDTIQGYKNFEIDNAKIIYIPANQGISILSRDDYDIEKPAIVYLLNFYLDENYLKIAKKITIYKSPLGFFAKMEL